MCHRQQICLCHFDLFGWASSCSIVPISTQPPGGQGLGSVGAHQVSGNWRDASGCIVYVMKCNVCIYIYIDGNMFFVLVFV